MKRVAIILPTYNESKNIEKLIGEIFNQQKKLKNWQLHVLVVDSNSPDGTSNLVKKTQSRYDNLHLLKTEKEGLGKAYIAGFTYVVNHLSPTVIFEMDADFSHSPSDIPFFLKEIEKGSDFVIGARYIKGGSIPKDWALHRKMFSIFGNLIVRFGLMKLSVTDWTSGFRAIKTWIVKDIAPQLSEYSGYVFQVALLDKAIKKGAKVAEIPIHFLDRKHGVSKINSFQYIIQTLFYVLTKSSFIKYVVVGLTGAVLDFGISYFLIEKLHWYLWIATLLSAECAIISNFLFNNFWSFSHKKIDSKFSLYVNKFLKFNTISAGALGIQAGGIELAGFLFGRKYWYIYKVLIIAFVIIPYSYILYNKVVWKEKK
ncbi:hypothetical protein A3G67_05065 [Candidatus Roizmanbacteria bacterium RIFCSPLOWO2_12_FULL_40_12]|uniref:Glycosyltransferase 2-like domain-containing protein n=1 Tax=Candidatus Roizmanbacteria bacterium RIFCSPLOWO2_01_FULL_40_42 TaxID=1802066 RepID=A0A1F7J4F5_9BACT|nr:MAG: hypothetical protein A2779_04085 [Candidatus Roizmanbacteria bacterium RIFCSPHIGHO2_01_FULL_40_98]OGK27257.1 MAG: hypothetical protein A3C31_04410 [Candidatus Roizmanbacteria bacterium RIFCSPHIGHO2_02_FULL_40_53]OGK30871.1 MAG: hypothetical protein A2W49_02630 [Candidatus Roizmanbacteria bacterium RIFCSPHIGHO2_12_41_18]OGK36362.1 MAG: hypothetical protein A3E69_02035 [Candidatus Roizmanbacteria bacterium RIFCSPHIGHO2_12_FULL_40_130]OGK50490.1 MAG: hypothetical protein A3B50_01765 [Candi